MVNSQPKLKKISDKKIVQNETASTPTTPSTTASSTPVQQIIKLTVKDDVNKRASVRSVRNNSIESYHHYQYINVPNIITFKRGRSKIPTQRLKSATPPNMALSTPHHGQDGTASSSCRRSDDAIQLILDKPKTRRTRNSTGPPQVILNF